MNYKTIKPLGGKAYGHIPHFPGSRIGPGDHHCHEGQALICTIKSRDKHDSITVTEKLDGTCVAVTRLNGAIIPLGRSGYPASSSPYEQHHLFHDWVMVQTERFLPILYDGERIVGEWLAQAHGTRYALPHEPFVVFDLFSDCSGKENGHRVPVVELDRRAALGGFVRPRVVSSGGPASIEQVMDILSTSGHGAIDPVEGAVWRVERQGKFDFLAKYVRPDKVDGVYLPERSGGEAIWNWRPA